MAYSEPGSSRRRIYQFVRERIEGGDPPTVREIQHHFGFRSVQTVQEHLEALIREGSLERTGERRARAYRLPRGAGGRGGGTLIPLLGRVQAGRMTTAVEDIEGYLPVDSGTESEELFGLRVRGESMRDAGILPGDVVIVRRQSEAPAGSIVVALNGEEATVKRLRFRDGVPELHPENPAFEPIVPDAEEFRILGKVVEVRRSLEGRYGG
ncbi:MAG: transcriptional repressor LexA [Alkalispirochaetaceae bacterium]